MSLVVRRLKEKTLSKNPHVLCRTSYASAKEVPFVIAPSVPDHPKELLAHELHKKSG